MPSKLFQSGLILERFRNGSEILLGVHRDVLDFIKTVLEFVGRNLRFWNLSESVRVCQIGLYGATWLQPYRAS
jgi:hypothetical protein